MEDCIFCKMVAGTAPAHKIWEDDKHLAFLTIFPNTPGVSVVITKEHNPSYIFENTDQVVSDLALASKKVATILDATFEDVGRTGLIFEGFGIDHLHSKLYPMHGTGNMDKWKMIESGSKKDFFDRYPGYLSSNDSLRADDAELSKIAAKIVDTAKKLNI